MQRIAQEEMNSVAGPIINRHVDASPKPVLRRLILPMAAIVILLMAGWGWLLYQQHQQMLSKESARDSAEVSSDPLA